MLAAVTEAGRIHRQVFAELSLIDGESLLSLANRIEHRVIELGGCPAFPTGLSLNCIAAHDSPGGTEKRCYHDNDTLKVDFGVHVDGYIVDAARTFGGGPLVEATREATETIVRKIGVDSRIAEVGEIASEIIQSYEAMVRGKMQPVKVIGNLCGHSIRRWKVHGGVVIPNVPNDTQERFEAESCYAIETFASLGKGHVNEEGVCSHYQVTEKLGRPRRHHEFLSSLSRYQGLPFCRRWLDRDISPSHLSALISLEKEGFLVRYPPLVDNGLTSQHEHTILVRESGTIVLA